MKRPTRKDVFVCTRCGDCCRWPGYVRLKRREVEAIAEFLELSPDEFTERYTRLTDDRKSLSLKEKDDGTCVFLSGNDVCTIQAVKPRQCRDFPNGWRFPNFEKECPAIKLRLRIHDIPPNRADAANPYPQMKIEQQHEEI